MRGDVLVLAGTAEARALLARCGGLRVTASLAGATDSPRDLGVPTRRGGFGGAEGFRAALALHSAVLDATHPFASTISTRTATICAARAVPYLRLTRAPWPTEPGWIRHADATACAEALPAGARVLLTAGPGALDPFLGRGLDLTCRRVDPAPARAGVDWVIGTPPFTERDEAALMRDRAITHLVTKNSGGSRAKLDAARRLGVSVHVIDRPPPPPGDETHDIDRAYAFILAHADHRRAG
ncbi:precorrin-6A/cobalt-precorrin-6A reductase [uncultured Jannaschia sp.]|uniref:precorrin-6A/cobalt-precorrin-6A reductase n=1 Tax=uncultured Jannaschia sp. TaxID=293347 RepID=UPI00261D4A17|nr:precorrin-6A/cobalt-precorrin-6A reductase [uncultured Jannaschia sp.]